MEERNKELTNKRIIIIKRKTLLLYSTFAVFFIMIGLGYYFFFYNQSLSIVSTIQPFVTETLEAKFARLNSANSNFCAGPDFLDNINVDKLQGACCSEMDLHRYKEQLEGLKEYSKIEKIPSDPYDIPRELADELLDYQKNIKLTSEQQKIYDEAVGLSHEGGPCCCKCWRWYAFEGQAKYLIVEEGFTAEQIAEVWDLEDGCGGPGHIEGVSGD